MWRRHAASPSGSGPPVLNVESIRRHFDFPATGRVVTNNAASTQPPRELLELYRSLAPWYENVHRGQSSASQRMTAMFEESYDTIATWLGAPSRRSIVTYRNTTEAINAVMYSLQSEFRDGDNVVTTMMEHNSNFVPWYALSREILPRFGRRVECRVARFDHRTGELDLDHLADLVDGRTKLVCVTGASNFLGTKPPLPWSGPSPTAAGTSSPRVRSDRCCWSMPHNSRPAPAWTCRPSTWTTWRSPSTNCSPRSASACSMRRSTCSTQALPFLYGGDMIAEGRVAPDHVDYNVLPWKYAAGTPNILGVIVSAQALRLVLDLVAGEHRWFGTSQPIPREAVVSSMNLVAQHTAAITEHALACGARHRRAHRVRTGSRHAALSAARLQRDRHGPDADRARVERPRCGVPGRLPLRHARAPRPRPDSPGELPTQFRLVFQRGRRLARTYCSAPGHRTCPAGARPTEGPRADDRRP